MELRGRPSSHLLGGTLGVFLAEALIVPTGLLTAIFLTRRLGPEGYGLFTLAATVVAWIEWSVASVFSRTAVKALGEADDWRPVGTTLLRLLLGAGLGAAALLGLLAGPIATLLDEPALAPYLYVFALGVPLFGLSYAHRLVLTGTGRFYGRALAGASRWMARLLLIVVLVELGLSVQGAVLGTIGASFVELAVSRFYARPSLSGRPAFPARQLLNAAVPLVLLALSVRLFEKLDLFALKILDGTVEQAGIYGAAQNLALLPGVFALSFSPLLLASLSRARREDDGDQRARLLARDALRLVVCLLPLGALVAGTAAEIVELLFGAPFLPAAPIVAILTFGALALLAISVLTTILIAAGRAGRALLVVGPIVPLAAAGHILLIPRLGTVGAATVTTVCAGLGALAAVLAVYHLWRILPPARTMLRSGLVCALAYALAVLWPASGAMLLAKLSLIGLMIPLVLLALGELRSDELARARSGLRRLAVV